MKILLVADRERPELWENWPAGQNRIEGIDLILSAGDLAPEYLEFLVSVTDVPLLYVRGNHDGRYDEEPPAGCTCIEDRIVDVYRDPVRGFVRVQTGRGRRPREGRPGALPESEAGCAGRQHFRIAGLGGSVKYREGSRDMYTEREMARRVSRLRRGLRIRAAGDRSRAALSGGTSEPGPVLDILLTHAPCAGYGDLDDLPHKGFACFNAFLEEFRPEYHCHGHIHMEYGRIGRELEHPSGTTLLNGSGMLVFDI